MTVKTGSTWAGLFVTLDATGALAAGTPSGVLYVDGTANGASVTITGSNPYKFSVTLPTLTAGQRVDMYITATIDSISTAGIVASEQADTTILSDGVAVASIANNAITAAAIATDAIDADSIKSDAITEIQAGLATPTNITAGTITTVTNLTNLPAMPNDWLTAAGVKADAVTKIATGVWASATRTLSSFGTLVADIWGAATRTLSAFGFTVATNSDANVTAIKAKTDNLPASPAAVGSAMTLSNNAITAAVIATDAVTEIQNGLATAANLQTVDDNVDAVKAKTDQLTFSVANQVDANALSGGGGLDAAGVRGAIGLAAANLDEQLEAIVEDTSTSLPAAISNIPAGITAEDVMTAIVEGATSLRDSLKLANAMMAGKISGGNTDTIVLRDLADTLDRIAFTVDENGNRMLVIRNLA